MPAESQAQRGFLYATFGPEWVRKHHFDNPGPLPEHVRQAGGRFATHGREVKSVKRGRRS